MSTISKPMKSVQELVEHMKSKGITFNIVSQEDAVRYMEDNNNYFRVASYRKNYNKQLDSNQLITANFDFLKLVIDNWFSTG